VLRTIAQPVPLADLELTIKVSIGIAIYPEHGASGGQKPTLRCTWQNSVCAELHFSIAKRCMPLAHRRAWTFGG
jgi:hypothetical protein